MDTKEGAEQALKRTHRLSGFQDEEGVCLRRVGGPWGTADLGGVDNCLYTGQIYWAPVTQELYWQIGFEE